MVNPAVSSAAVTILSPAAVVTPILTNRLADISSNSALTLALSLSLLRVEATKIRAIAAASPRASFLTSEAFTFTSLVVGSINGTAAAMVALRCCGLLVSCGTYPIG